jgi:hypothetical protein
MSNAQAANELFVEATQDESGLTFQQIVEKLDSVGYWQLAGLSDASRSEQRKHTRSKLRSLHIDGLPVFSAYRGGKHVRKSDK